MNSSMSNVLRTSSSKQNSSSSGIPFEMVSNDICQQKLEKLANRRSAVERLEETKAQYVKTERVLDSKQNFEYGSSYCGSIGPELDTLVNNRVKSLYDCQNIINYAHSINFSDDNLLNFTKEFAPENNSGSESRISPELRKSFLAQRKSPTLRRSYRDYGDAPVANHDGPPALPPKGKHVLPQPFSDPPCVSINGCAQLSLNSGPSNYERETSFTNGEKLEIRIEHSDNEENSLEPSDGSFTVDDEVAENGYKKQGSRTSDYVSRSSSFKCSVSSDRVKNLVKSFESKMCCSSPSNSNSATENPTKPVTRSKSDVSCRFSKTLCVASEPTNSTDVELERFFDTMGLDNNLFSDLTSPPRSPVSFFDSVSSVNSETNLSAAESEDSALEVPKEGLTNSDLRKHAPTETSIVEKNARVVKWLYYCHNAFKKNPS